MVGAGPRHLFEKVVVAERFDQTDRDALLRQCQRQAQPDRPGADDDHAVGGSIHASRARVSCSSPAGLTRGSIVFAEATEVLARQGMDCRVKPGNDGLSRAPPHQFFAATTSFTAPTQPVWVRSNTMPSGSLYFAS